MAILKNIDIDKAILENIDIDIDIDEAILQNIDIKSIQIWHIERARVKGYAHWVSGGQGVGVLSPKGSSGRPSVSQGVKG